MGDLAVDTAVHGGDGRYTCVISRDWEIWGPNGGYVASVALRAAGEHSRFHRPASIVGHFLGVADFDTVTIDTATLRAAKRAESIRVSLAQHGRPIFEGLVWAVDELDGLAHDTTRMPDAPDPESVPTILERLAEIDEEGRTFPFWDNLEERPLRWVDDWENRPTSDPVFDAWFRYRPTATFTDPWVEACRSLILVDTLIWPAAHRRSQEADAWVAPSIDILAGFHRFRPDEPFLFARAEAPSAHAGMIGGHAHVWSRDGALLASGAAHLLCRPAPGP